MTPLATLPLPYIRVYHLWRWGHTSEEIADRCELAPETVADIARRLRQKGLELPRHPRGRAKVADRKAGKRPCLGCGRVFWSHGVANRFCTVCKEGEGWGLEDHDFTTEQVPGEYVDREGPLADRWRYGVKGSALSRGD